MTDETAQLFFEEYTNKPTQDFQTLAQSGSSRINFVGKSAAKKK